MKKIINLTILLFGFITFAQNFSGIASYELKVNPEKLKSTISNIPNLDAQSKRMYEEKLRKSLEKSFSLTFNKTNSIYKEEQKLDLSSNNNNDDGSWSPYGMDVAFYKNLKDKVFITEKDLMSKLFYVKDSLEDINWVFHNETKKIGNYTCQKASAKIIIENEDYRQEDNDNSTNFFDNKEKEEEKIIIAWYTIDIPINQGPSLYWGLPGLILEIEDNGDRLICSKIVINPKKKPKIKMPKDKELISSKEYNILVEKKLKELDKNNIIPKQ
jgi:GLPGLI family protein